MRKKKKKKIEDSINLEPSQRDSLTIRRTAKEAKKSTIIVRTLALVAVLLIMTVAIMYAVSYFYDKLGSFTIRVNKYDMAKQGLTLSLDKDIKDPTSRLNAKIIEDMYNISGLDLPKNLDQTMGSHNGDNYIAYTFYIANSGSDTVTAQYSVDMSNITKNIDAAIRIRLIQDGKTTDWAKAKTNGKPEAGTSIFPSKFVAANGLLENFRPGDKKKITIVVWLEGNDPDCINNIIGGSIKLDMNFEIIENS